MLNLNETIRVLNETVEQLRPNDVTKVLTRNVNFTVSESN